LAASDSQHFMVKSGKKGMNNFSQKVSSSSQMISTSLLGRPTPSQKVIASHQSTVKGVDDGCDGCDGDDHDHDHDEVFL
jgi:hypothetical protein